MTLSSRRLLQVGICWFLLVLAPGAFASSLDDVSPAELRAAWIRSIVLYASWPESRQRSSVLIGVLGSDSRSVVEVLRNRIDSGLKINDRSVRLMELDPLIDNPDSKTVAAYLERCDLLLFSSDSMDDWIRIRPIVENMPIITVSGFEGFSRLGGFIELLPDPKKSKQIMIVNMDAMQRTGVNLSSKMLSLKSIVLLRDQDTAK